MSNKTSWILTGNKVHEVTITSHEVRFIEQLATALDGSFRISVSPNRIFESEEAALAYLNKFSVTEKIGGN